MQLLIHKFFLPVTRKWESFLNFVPNCGSAKDITTLETRTMTHC